MTMTEEEEKILQSIIIPSENNPNKPEFPPGNPKFPATPTFKIEVSGFSNVWLKDESVNPTGTHKDRMAWEIVVTYCDILLAKQQGIRSIAPVRKGARRGKRRRELMRSFPQKTYNKRNRNENTNYVFKNKYGDSLQAVTVKGRRAEIATKVLAHNLWARLKAITIELFNMTLPAKSI